MPNNSSDSTALHSLLQLTLSPANTDHAVAYLGSLRPEEREHFESVADSNHVVVRALQAALSRLQPGSETASWATEVIARQEQRIQNALPVLHRICQELESAGCSTTVMKSLDHW